MLPPSGQGYLQQGPFMHQADTDQYYCSFGVMFVVNQFHQRLFHAPLCPLCSLQLVKWSKVKLSLSVCCLVQGRSTVVVVVVLRFFIEENVLLQT